MQLRKPSFLGSQPSGPSDVTTAITVSPSRTSRDELIAELESMLETLRQCRDGERGHIRPRVPPANNDAASLAPAGEAGQEIGRLEGDMDEMRELFSRSNLNETGQKIVRVEGDLQMLLNAYIPGQMYPSAQPPSYN
ncbi:hypothetical protein ARSEF4850_006676 [Beauveria asiatica]